MLTTPILKKTTWVSYSFTLTKEVTQCFHKIFFGIGDLNIEKMMVLTEYNFLDQIKGNIRNFRNEDHCVFSDQPI